MLPKKAAPSLLSFRSQKITDALSQGPTPKSILVFFSYVNNKSRYSVVHPLPGNCMLGGAPTSSLPPSLWAFLPLCHEPQGHLSTDACPSKKNPLPSSYFHLMIPNQIPNQAPECGAPDQGKEGPSLWGWLCDFTQLSWKLFLGGAVDSHTLISGQNCPEPWVTADWVSPRWSYLSWRS